MYGHRSEQDKALAFHKKRMLLQVALLLLDWSCLFIQSFKVSFQGGSFVTWKSVILYSWFLRMWLWNSFTSHGVYPVLQFKILLKISHV